MRQIAALIALLAFVAAHPTRATAQSESSDSPTMKILVHITHGPESPTRAALGFHVARAAIEEGHEVAVFLAGDAVQLLREGTLSHLVGLGTGNLRDLYDALTAAGTPFYVSGGSSKARGLDASELEGKNIQFASPGDLVRLSVEHDRMFTY